MIMAAAGVLAVVAVKLLTVRSFYQFGHYRGDSVAEVAAETPNYKGVEYCSSCHRERVAEWSKGAHNKVDAGKVVRCEVCHGAAGNREPHGVTLASAGPAEHPRNLKMTIPGDSRQLCTLCHEKTAGRPAEQPQIVVADHAGTQQCAVCHNPHSPKLGGPPAGAAVGDPAAGKLKAAACAGCHGAEGVSANLPGPTLAGQNAAYFVEAMKAYATGARENPMMSAAVQGMSEADVNNIAAYYAGLKCESSLTAEKQGAAPGKAAASKCIGCHGADGESSNAAWPSLVGLSKEHLLETLKAYKSGARKNALMAGAIKDLSDADTESLAAYYAGATCK
jgi:cytochrome c553